MNEQDIISSYKKICEYEKEIVEIQAERIVQEQALAIVYKVDECNKARNTLALNYQQQINEKYAQIKALKEQLGTKSA